MSSIFGEKIKISIFGESHSKAIGMTLDGVNSGFKVDFEELNLFMKRRKSTTYKNTTQRKESDDFEFLSGIENGYTSGFPISGIIYNKDYNKKDYDILRAVPRPGHSDYPAMIKYGKFASLSGGGHFSGRLTAPICLGGGILLQQLEKKGILIETSILEIGGKRIDETSYTISKNECGFSLDNNTKLEKTKKELLFFEEIFKEAIDNKDSVGGIVSCTVKGLPIGLGRPIFGSIESYISQIIFAIPGIKGIEFGSGFFGSKLKGSENNDSYRIKDNEVKINSNNHGGVLGGLSTGNNITFNVAVKPVSSIGIKQKSVSLESGENVDLEIIGRHDPCIIPRVLPVIEACTSIAITNLDGFEM